MISQTRNFLHTSEMVAAGSNELGQFGFGQKASKCKKYDKPKFFNFNIKITGISCGFNHTAFIVDDSLIYTVGSNEYGKLGISDSKIEYSSSPILLETLTNHIIKKVACGFSHSVAITSEGEIFTWGNGSEGQLGLGETPEYINAPFQLDLSNLKKAYCFSKFKEISCGEKHTLVLSENGFCFGWGSSEFGQLGTGKNEKELFPVFLSFFVKKTIKAISCGYSHSLFLTKSKNIYATGYNNHGELGLGNNLSSYLPDKISKLKHENITSISAGSHSSAITEKGDLYIWGSGVFGEFSYPQKMNSNEKFIDVEIGLGFGTGLDMNGQLYMWGENQWGQLGFGDFTPRITLTQNSSFKDKKLKKIACGGQYFIGIFEDADMSVQKRNIIDNIMNMNDMTTSKKKCQVDNMSNRKIIVNSTEIKNKRPSKKETLKENDTIKETIKLKSLFQQDETNIVGGLKSLDSCKYSKAKICKGQEKQNTLSISFDNSNNTSNNNYINRPSLHNSIEIKTFEQKQDDETEDSINLIKNKQNGMEFKIKIKEYEDCIRLLEFKEKKAKAQMKEQERSHNEKYHQLSQIYNEIKNQYETVCEESVKIEEKFQKETIEKKKTEEKIKQFIKEKNEWNKILVQQTIDIDALHESIMIIANDMEKKDRDLIKLYNLKEKDKSMIKLLRSQLEENIMKLDALENKKQNKSSDVQNYKQILEKKEIEIISMKSELEELCNKLEISQNEKIIELQNIIQQKDLENDQMKTIIFELNTQNKIFREEMQNKRQLRSPAFQELKDDSSIYSHSHENMSQIDSKGMEINELYLSQRSEELINLQSPDKNLITPTEQKKTKKEIFETPLPLNNSVNSFGENHIELKDVLNNKNLNEVRLVDINEKRNEFPNKFKKTPAKKFESDKENLLSKNSTERNDFLLESISSSVYEKIVLSNKSLNNIKSRLTDLQKNRNTLEVRMKDFETKLTV